MDLYFSDHFKVKEKDLLKYGAFNVSLVSDLPLFIDPFLLFNSKKNKYKQLHDDMIKYLEFLREKSSTNKISEGALNAWYVFHEVVQNWFGFSVVGNSGRGLGMDFAKSLNENLYLIFKDFGNESVTKGSHLEKLCLIKDGVGRDNISDFTTNLIKNFLLGYTQTFAINHIDISLRNKSRVPRTCFNYKTETWEEAEFDLPVFEKDFVILTPRELLTKDDTWINKKDLLENFEQIPDSISDGQLRFQVSNYFQSLLARPKDTKKEKEPTKQERMSAAFSTIQNFPQLIDYYIKLKEDNGDIAESISNQKVIISETIYINNVQNFISGLQKTEFYASAESSYDEAKKKINILKGYIENNDGYKIFYDEKTGERIKGEKDLQLLFGLVCHESTTFDINREPNLGRGPVDYKLSKGSADKTLVEFKLASNKKLKNNLQNQVEIYQKANQTSSSFKVIIYFTEEEHKKVVDILNKLEMAGKDNIILIDGRNDNKISASNVK